MVMIEQGDGTIAKRLKLGLCPKCQTKFKDMEYYKRCKTCNLIVTSLEIKKEQKDEKNH